MRLNRFLASCGLGSRRSCEQLIREGRVFVNGEEVTSLGVQVGEDDEVIVDGKVLQVRSSVTLVLKKPRGVLCTRADEQVEKRETIYDLLPPHYHHLHYVGRLDKDSEGLLILTNSGKLTEQLTHPRFRIEKEYLVALDRVFQAEEHISVLEQGFPIEGGFAKASNVVHLEPRVVALTLTQGIKRQIRLMFEALGYEVTRLERVRIGGLTMPDLKLGRWRVLTQQEIDLLLQPAKPPALRPVPTGPRPLPRPPQPKDARGPHHTKPNLRARKAGPASRSSSRPPFAKNAPAFEHKHDFRNRERGFRNGEREFRKPVKSYGDTLYSRERTRPSQPPRQEKPQKQAPEIPAWAQRVAFKKAHSKKTKKR